MNSKSPFVVDIIPAVVAITFAFFALTFGMAEWRDTSVTASVPSVSTQQ